MQVKTLQLEREQSQVLLESVQQRHKQDMELIENAHKYELIPRASDLTPHTLKMCTTNLQHCVHA